MKLLEHSTTALALTAFAGMLFFAAPVLADGDHSHSHPEEKGEMKMEMEKGMKMDMDMHQHAPLKKERAPKLPPGTKEVKIDLSGPFCHKHPKEITEGLMKLEGVLHIEAFSGRRYILVHFDGSQIQPEAMATALGALKGSGWRCSGSSVSSKKRTER